MATTLTVHLSERSYPIHFGSDLSAEVRAFVGELTSVGRKFAVITDANLQASQGGALRAMFGEALLRDGIVRAVNGLEESTSLSP